jgi:signal transduction histidine kinase
VDLAELASAVCARYAGARVAVIAGGSGRCVVAGQAGGLDRLLVNLIDNAVRYARSRVSVATRGEGSWVLLSVTDDGPGIPEQDAERVFDRFTRLDDARSRDADPLGASLAGETPYSASLGGETPYGGSGLGLAIVRGTAIAHGGEAWLEDAGLGDPGPGLRAMVRLPAAPGQHGGDRDDGEQQGEVGDRQVEQAHRGGRGR